MTPRAALDFSLASLAFFAPLSIAGTNLSLAAASLAALWACSSRETRPALRETMDAALRSPVFLLLAAGFAWSLVAALAGLDPARSLRAVPKELHKLWSYALIAVLLGLARRRPALAALAAGLAAHAAVGLYQALTPGAEAQALVRARGFIHPVSYGNILGLGFLVAAAFLARAPARERGRPAAAALAAFLGAAIALNQTRAVAAALGAAALAAALASARPRRALAGASLALVAVLAFWELMPTGGRNIRTLLSHDPNAAGHRTRFILWEVAVQMARERPLTGVGPGMFRDTFQRLRPGRLDAEGSWGSAHNLFLHQLAERGAPGLLLLLALFAALGREAWRAARRRADAAGLWALAATAAFLVMNLTEAAWQTEQVATFFLLVWLWGAGPPPRGEVL